MFVITLVSYDEKNGFSGLFSSIEKLRELPTVSKEATTFLEKLSESTSISNQRFKRLAKDCDVTKDAVFQFAQGIRDGSIQLKDGQTMLQGYQSYLKSTSKSLTLADIKTKALSASMKVFSTIGWMAIA